VLAKDVMEKYKPLRTRIENIDISTPFSNSDLKQVNLPIMASYIALENESTEQIPITPLCYAVQRQSPKLVKFLLENGANQMISENMVQNEDTDG